MIFIGSALVVFGAWDGFGVFGGRGELASHWGDVGIAGAGALIILIQLLRIVGGRS